MVFCTQQKRSSRYSNLNVTVQNIMGYCIQNFKNIRTLDIHQIHEFTFVAAHFDIPVCTYLNLLGG